MYVTKTDCEFLAGHNRHHKVLDAGSVRGWREAYDLELGKANHSERMLEKMVRCSEASLVESALRGDGQGMDLLLRESVIGTCGMQRDLEDDCDCCDSSSSNMGDVWSREIRDVGGVLRGCSLVPLEKQP